MNLELRKLCKVVDFCADCIQSASIPSIPHLRGAKRHVFMLIMAAHNYSESVCVLCKQNRTQASLVLLRSICECLIKARYLYCNTRLHLWELRLEALKEKHKQLMGMNEFLASSNSTDAHLASLSIEDVESSLNQVNYPTEYCKRRFRKYGGIFNKKGEPIIRGTLSKAQYVDKHNSNLGRKSESLAYFYHLVYRQLSSSVHLDGRNFSEFISCSKEGYEVLLSGNPKLVPDVSATALWIYQDLMRQLFLIFRIPRIRQMKVILAND